MPGESTVPVRVVKNEQATVVGPTQQLTRVMRTTFMVGETGNEDGPFTVDSFMQSFDLAAHRSKIEQLAANVWRLKHNL